MDQTYAKDEPSVKEKQEARSFLRERFIRAVTSMNAKPGTFQMYENTNASASFGSCDRDFAHVHVKNLQTPLGAIPDAILRTHDVVCINFPDINPS